MVTSSILSVPAAYIVREVDGNLFLSFFNSWQDTVSALA